ncbi:MAG TPA: hypothetical protein DCZ13_13360 [Porticoccaceae bacterium]|nr:hypothetical protein [Porticoccaceae bacterium]
MPDKDNYQLSPSLDVVIATLLYLMTRYSSTQCPQIRMSITQHLALLRDHPEASGSNALLNTAKNLVGHWNAPPKGVEREPIPATLH